MGRRTALVVGGAIAVALALGGLVGGVLAESPSAGSPSVVPTALPERVLAGTAGGVSAGTVASLEGRARATPTDPELLVQLGFAYQLRWRESADASYLPRSEAALRRARRAGGEDANVMLGLEIGRASCRERVFRVV